MAIRMESGSPETFNYLIYGEKDPRTLNYLENQINSFSNVVTTAGNQFFDDVRSMYEKVNGSEALRVARAAIRQAKAFFNEDVIRPLSNIGDIQTAGLKMQRWIMAEPTLRGMYNQQLVDGYSNTYLDLYSNTVADTHYDYRRVMDGVIKTDEDGTDCIEHYFESLVDGDRDLDIDEVADIQGTWETVRALLNSDDRDPTSVWDSKR